MHATPFSLSSSFSSLSLMKFTQKVNAQQQRGEEGEEERERVVLELWNVLLYIIIRRNNTCKFIDGLLIELMELLRLLAAASRIVLLRSVLFFFCFLFFISSLLQFTVWPLFFIDCFISISFSFFFLRYKYIIFYCFIQFFIRVIKIQSGCCCSSMEDDGGRGGAVQRWLK